MQVSSQGRGLRGVWKHEQQVGSWMCRQSGSESMKWTQGKGEVGPELLVLKAVNQGWLTSKDGSGELELKEPKERGSGSVGWRGGVAEHCKYDEGGTRVESRPLERCRNADTRDLWIWSYLEIGSLQMIKIMSSGWALIQYGSVLIKIGHLNTEISTKRKQCDNKRLGWCIYETRHAKNGQQSTRS